MSFQLRWFPMLSLSVWCLALLSPLAASGQAGTLQFTESLFAAGEASATARIEFRRSGGTVGAVSVTFSTSAGSATPGADYVETSTTVEWANDDGADKVVDLGLLDDGVPEGVETVRLDLSNPTGGATLGSLSTAELMILDDDGPGGGCTANATTLCLQGGRFRVTVNWRTPNGNQGVGMGVPLTGDTGYFWFFNPANVEMVLKVLRGCSNNGNFWVFAGGLTNVEATITVVDTETLARRVYINPLRTPFEPLQDTGAFSCP